MENRNLMQDLVEKMGEESQLDMIVEKSLQLALVIKKLKRTNRKEDYENYSIAYNEACERVADMRLMVEQAEFLFNTNSINDHYNNKIQHLKEALKVF
jgi:hypothetical protein